MFSSKIKRLAYKINVNKSLMTISHGNGNYRKWMIFVPAAKQCPNTCRNI